MSAERQILSGIAASPGVAVGRVCVVDRSHVYVPRRYVSRDQLGSEEKRLHEAIEASRMELENIRARIGSLAENRLLLDAQLLMHRDELLIDGAIELLRERSINAEWALAQVIARIAGRMREANEEYFRERAVDIEHVGQRIQHKLVGGDMMLPQVGPDTVIVADDLGPADAAQLLRSMAGGIAIDLGSASSHTAILARALHIPAVVGVRNLSSLVADDDLVIVDAFRGEVILSPSEEELRLARSRGERYRTFTQGLRERAGPSVQTRDGTQIVLDANVEVPPEAGLALSSGASGIGLYRTEFLYLDRSTAPNEEEQTRIYRDVAQVLAPRPVVFRTFDMGGDRLHGFGLAMARGASRSDPSAARADASPARGTSRGDLFLSRGTGRFDRDSDLLNPALGLRALRLGLAHPELLITQLRAMLRASELGNVRIMFPLVTSLEELRNARTFLTDVRRALESEGVTLGEVKVGCMIEVPSAALTAASLAKECDFFSVGTNDLVQYTVAVDRSNPRVAHLGNPLHPAVLRLLEMTVRAGRAQQIDVSMCGGMAADLIALPVVLGLGYEHLSVDIGYLPLTRACIERVDLAVAREVAALALECGTAEEVRALVMRYFRADLAELWEEQGLIAVP
jgi:phosphotransferase system enzyme I (PtsI)